MELRQQLTEYRAKLADAADYPRIPSDAKALVLENLDRLLAADDGQDLTEWVWNFRRGAARFLCDQFSKSDLEDLMGDMPKPDNPSAG